MYGRQEARAALSKRPHAVEKAMQMKIKVADWRNHVSAELTEAALNYVFWATQNAPTTGIKERMPTADIDGRLVGEVV